MSNTKKLISCALCIALGIVLPMAFHAIPNSGKIFLPMHLPVLLCGMITGPLFGLACGVITPLLSSLMTGMPPAPVLPGMLCELAVYGLVGGLLINLFKFKGRALNLYVTLICAMLSGRLVAGIVNGFIFQAGAYTFEAWIAASFVTALPGIAIQLVIIPLLIAALERAHVIAPLTAGRAA